jgi:hypothetical protein
MNEKFDFGTAIKYLKEGKCLCREGWNGKNMFICKQIPCTLEGLVIDKIQSLPTSAKEILKNREGVPTISYTNQCLIVNKNGRADSWVCSISDMFAEDWMLYNEE